MARLYGECVAKAEHKPVSKIDFTFEGDTVAALLTLIATKCRRREARLKAVSLSKRLSWREGAWDDNGARRVQLRPMGGRIC